MLTGTPVAAAVRAATAEGEPDAWWHYLGRRLQDATGGSVFRFAEREANEMRWLVQQRMKRMH